MYGVDTSACGAQPLNRAGHRVRTVQGDSERERGTGTTSEDQTMSDNPPEDVARPRRATTLPIPHERAASKAEHERDERGRGRRADSHD